MLHAGIEIKEDRICWIDTRDMKSFSAVFPKVLERLKNCTACVCYNDEVAHELTSMALAENVNIPEAFSLTSIDNSELARLNAVPLTSVTHPMEALGYKVAESMLRLIAPVH